MTENGCLLLVDEYTWPLSHGEAGCGLDGGLGAAASGGRAGARMPRHVRFDVGESGGPGSASPPAVGEADHGEGIKDDDGSVEWAAALAASDPAPKKGSAAYFRNLPLATRVSFQPHATKPGKSRARLEKCRTATTLLELQRLNPGKFMADLKFDYDKGFSRSNRTTPYSVPCWSPRRLRPPPSAPRS